MKKSIKSWLKTLPAGFAELALKYEYSQRWETQTFRQSWAKHANSLADAIESAFSLSRTDEGYEFWHDVRTWARNPETKTLPSLPYGKN